MFKRGQKEIERETEKDVGIIRKCRNNPVTLWQVLNLQIKTYFKKVSVWKGD